MTTVATLTFDLVAKSAKLVTELGKANKHTKKWADETRKKVNSSVKVFAGLTAAGVAGMAAIYASSSKTADALGKFSDKIGEAPEKMQGIQRAAQLTGVSVETANMAFQRMTRRVAEAGQGTGEAVKALKELNLDAKDLAKLSPADQFSKIADAMQGVKNQGDRVRLSMKLFDSEGVALVNTLALGSKGLQEVQQEVKDYGLELTRMDIAKIEAANDAWFRASEVTASFGQQLAVEVSPLVEAVSNEFLNAAKEAGGFGSVASKVVGYLVKAVGFAADTVRGLQVAWSGVKLVVAETVSTIIRAMADADKAVSSFLDNIPYIEAKPSQILANMAEALKSTSDDISTELQGLLMKPMPSGKIEAWVDNVVSQATKAAKKSVQKNGSISSVITETLSPRSEEFQDSLAEMDKALTDLQNKNTERQQSSLKTFTGLMGDYKTVSANAAAHIEDSFANAFDNMATGFSSGVARGIVEGESLNDVWQNVAKTLAIDVVAGLIKVGIQMAINKAFGKASQAEAVVSAGGVGLAIATAYAPAAALVSLASFGSNAVPAQAGIASTVALSEALALTGMAHDGIDSIP